jgi:Ni,Fe-hydrogenase maturation factor
MKRTEKAGKIKILVFGNALVTGDSLPLRLMPALRRRFRSVEFVEFDAAESLESEGRDLVILDTAKGPDRVVLLEGIDKVETGKIHSMHDFDLALTLKIMRKMGLLDSVRIIAVPAGYPQKKALEETCALISAVISSLPSKSA